MVFPILPQQGNNYNSSRMPRHPNNRFRSHMNRPATGNGIQQFIQNISSPNSSIGNLANRGLGNVSKTLSNVDQVIKVVQSATPIVKEYGPMVKNLPAMYRMVKAFSQIEDDNEIDTDKTNSRVEIESEKNMEQGSLDERDIKISRGESTPKLFI